MTTVELAALVREYLTAQREYAATTSAAFNPSLRGAARRSWRTRAAKRRNLALGRLERALQKVEPLIPAEMIDS